MNVKKIMLNIMLKCIKFLQEFFSVEVNSDICLLNFRSFKNFRDVKKISYLMI